MYSEKNDQKEVKDFMKGLGFPSNEEGDVFDNVIKCFAGKEVTLTKGNLSIVGILHSVTLIFGNHLNLTQVKEDQCSPGILEELHYYHPRNFKSNLEPKSRNYAFVSAAFTEEKDPEKDDLLVVPADGCTLTCEGFSTTFPEGGEENEEEQKELKIKESIYLISKCFYFYKI